MEYLLPIIAKLKSEQKNITFCYLKYIPQKKYDTTSKKKVSITLKEWGKFNGPWQIELWKIKVNGKHIRVESWRNVMKFHLDYKEPKKVKKKKAAKFKYLHEEKPND